MEPGKSPLWKGKYMKINDIHRHLPNPQFQLPCQFFLGVYLTLQPNWQPQLVLLGWSWQPLQRETWLSSLSEASLAISWREHKTGASHCQGSHGDSKKPSGGFGSEKKLWWMDPRCLVDLGVLPQQCPKWSGRLGQMPATWVETRRPPVSKCLTNRWTSTNFTVSGSCWRYFVISPTYRTRSFEEITLDSSHATIFLTSKIFKHEIRRVDIRLEGNPKIGSYRISKKFTLKKCSNWIFAVFILGGWSKLIFFSNMKISYTG